MPTKPKADAKFPWQISLFPQRETPDAFRKAVQVLHSKPKSPLTLMQRKLGNSWLKNAFENKPDDEGWWQLRITDLAKDIGFDSNNRQYLRESVEGLMRIVFEWDVLAPANKRVEWKASVLFPEVEIRQDLVRYQMSTNMRESMMNPEIYAMIDMNIVRRFRRAPALAIWEFCIRFEKIHHTAEVEWPKFRDMILGDANQNKTYQEYKYFKSKVLNPCIKEINAETNHTVELIEMKSGKSVTSIRFNVQKKSQVDDVSDDDRTLELIGEMVKLGVPQSEAKKLGKAHSATEVSAAIEYTKKRVADRKLAKLEKPAAYFRQALANHYAATAMTAPPAAPQKLDVDIRKAFYEEQQKEASSYFKELDVVDQEQAIARYNSLQEMSFLRLTKRTSKLAEVTFLKWLAAETWGDPSPDELLEFAQKLLSNQK
jgi:Initiator Replication protein